MIPRPSGGHEGQMVLLKNVKFEYESGVVALKGVSLAIDRGEYVAVVGGNGSGKTTLAKHMNGLLRPTSGEVVIMGSSAADRTISEIARVVGYVFQNPDHQLFCATVTEEVAFGPANMGLPSQEVSARVDSALKTLGILDVKDRSPFSLTLGLRRKVSIASVLAMGPQVLVLDEPTTGLDSREARELMVCIRRLNDDGTTIVLITHDMKLVAEHTNRVVVMSEGRVLLDSNTRGAFSDMELLRQSKLLPPPVTKLAHRLSSLGVSKDVFTAEEMAFELVRGGAR